MHHSTATSGWSFAAKDTLVTMTLLDEPTATRAAVNHLRTFTDENTGRTIRQLTDFPHGANSIYFRLYRQLPDGRMLAFGKHEHGQYFLVDPESGDLELLPLQVRPLKFREKDGRCWFMRSKYPELPRAERLRKGRQIWHLDLPNGDPVLVAELPDDLPGHVEDITIDGKHLILVHREEEGHVPIPTSTDLTLLNNFLFRPRRGSIAVYDLSTGALSRIFEIDTMTPIHIDTSPADPGLLRYALDMPDALGQRIWTIRLDGTENHPIRPQQYGEMVTHEFWWSDPAYIGYTYQDRRQDPTLHTVPLAEYAQADTRLGIADLSGREVYLSDPLNSYHTHLYRSPDGTLVSGEGTDGNSYVYAARHSMSSTRLDLVQLATIHTPYTPFRGQEVDCNFSADSRWLVYADKRDPDGPHQLFAVEVDL